MRYIESQKNYLAIVTDQGSHLTYLTLTEIQEKLPPFFIRINKSCILNTEKISYIEGNEVVLLNKREPFSIGATFKDAFKDHMQAHLVKRKKM